MHSIRLVLLICALLTGAAASASEPTVAELVAGFEQARGGAKAWRELRTVRMSGVMQMGAISAPMALEFKPPGQVRLQFEVQGMSVVQAYDGERGWSAAPFVENGLPVLMHGQELEDMREMGDFAGALADYQAKGHQVSLDGEESIDDRPCWRLKVVKANGGQELWWLDKDSLLALRTASKRNVDGSVIGVASVLADYREVDGLLFPFSVTNRIQRDDESLEQIIVLDQIDLNVAIADQRFAFPL